METIISTVCTAFTVLALGTVFALAYPAEVKADQELNTNDVNQVPDGCILTITENTTLKINADKPIKGIKVDSGKTLTIVGVEGQDYKLTINPTDSEQNAGIILEENSTLSIEGYSKLKIDRVNSFME